MGPCYERAATRPAIYASCWTGTGANGGGEAEDDDDGRRKWHHAAGWGEGAACAVVEEGDLYTITVHEGARGAFLISGSGSVTSMDGGRDTCAE